MATRLYVRNIRALKAHVVYISDKVVRYINDAINSCS